MTRTYGLRRTLPLTALALIIGCDGDPAPLRPADCMYACIFGSIAAPSAPGARPAASFAAAA